jgi:signal recognition particle receptor subunit beta
MPELDAVPAPGRLSFKLVYYGPAQSGKTTNVMALHDGLEPALKGELMTLETQGDRTLFFDLLPIGFRAPSGLLVKFRLFTVPGQVQHDGTRKTVLSRADGVVFVADSQRSQRVSNGESFQNMTDNLARVGLDLASLPLVVQFNKRDLPAIDSEADLLARWSQAPWPVFFASAARGEGTAETFAALLRGVYRRYAGEYALAEAHGLDEDRFVAAATGREGEVHGRD